MENTAIEILLVEDNHNDAELTILALKKNNLGNHLIHLEDGVQALDFIFATGPYEGKDISIHPKLILLDIKMPRIDGIEVLKRVKSDERTKKIPVVILTSSNEDPDIQRCFALGANSFIVKPVGFDNFSKVVAELGFYWLLLNQAPR